MVISGDRTVIIGLLSLILACTPANKPAPAPEALALTGRAFGTTWSVKAVGGEQAKLEAAIDAALKRVDAGMSTWRPDSELSRFNAAPVGPFVFGEETARVIRRSMELAAKTDGAFDPTVRPLVKLWGFGSKAASTSPSDEAITATLANIGYRKLSWASDGALNKPTAELQVDLSAIAKGYGVDAVAAAVRKAGARSAMVEIGGEVVVFGERPGGGPWRLAVDAPTDDSKVGSRFAAVLGLRNVAMATSGDYRQFRMEGGRRVSHIIDPRSGQPIGHALASATVVAEDCATADAMATAIMVLGPEKGLKAVESLPGVEALLLVRNGEAWSQRMSSGMKAHIIASGAY